MFGWTQGYMSYNFLQYLTISHNLIKNIVGHVPKYHEVLWDLAAVSRCLAKPHSVPRFVLQFPTISHHFLQYLTKPRSCPCKPHQLSWCCFIWGDTRMLCSSFISFFFSRDALGELGETTWPRPWKSGRIRFVLQKHLQRRFDSMLVKDYDWIGNLNVFRSKLYEMLYISWISECVWSSETYYLVISLNCQELKTIRRGGASV